MNYINTISQMMYTKTTVLLALTNNDVTRQNVIVKTPPAFKLPKLPRLLAHKMNINAYDDYSIFKENIPSTNYNN